VQSIRSPWSPHSLRMQMRRSAAWRTTAMDPESCFLLGGGAHVRFRRVPTLVREGSPLVKLRNSA